MPIGHGELRCENLPGGLMVLPRQTVVLVTLALALSGPTERRKKYGRPLRKKAKKEVELS